MVFHADVRVGMNGYVGVDVFFALSGFLITMLLLGEHRTSGRIALGRFAIRRLLRLYPALVVLCLGVLALSILAHRFGDMAAAVAAGLLYVSNWWLYTGHDMVLLDHLWTLAIEEHFYLLWPTLLTLSLARSRPARAAATALVVAAVVVLVVPWAAAVAPVKDSYVRGAPILFGCLLALALRSPSVTALLRRAAPALALVGALVIVTLSLVPWLLPAIFLQGPSSLPGWAAVAVVIGVVLTPESLSVRWLRSRPLVWCGRRAYGIYLIHFPVLSLLAHQVSTPASPVVRAAIGVGLSLALAALSYRFVELPFLRLKVRFEPPTTPTAARD